MAKQLEKAGAHILGIKDMAGVCRPRAARELVKALKRGNRPADPLPHPRHQRHRRRQRAGGGRGRRRRRRRRARRHERPDLAAQPRLDRRGAAGTRTARSRRRPDAMRAISLYWEGVRRTTRPSRPTSAPAPPTSTATRCPAASTPTCASRRAPWASSTAGRRCRGLCRRQPAVRRHRQGDADLQGGGRHGAVHGRQRPDAGDVRTRRASRLPGIRGVAVQGRTRLPARRLSRPIAEKVLQGREAAAGARRRHLPRWIWRPNARGREGHRPPGERHRPRLLPDVSEGVQGLRRPPAPLRRRQRCCRRRPSSTAWREREEIAVEIDAGKTLVVRQQGRAPAADEEGESRCSSN
jgi:hypothetical protein